MTPVSTEVLPPVEAEKRKHQNLMALTIIFAGLFVGSLLVDFVQLFRGVGFSPWATRHYNVLETAGKTWVGYGDPKVELTVITDKNCSLCDPSEALVWLRRVVPTLEVTRIDIAEALGTEMGERLGIVSVPAFVFSKDILHTSFYSQASSLFEARGGRYVFDMSKIGLPKGRYIKLPTVTPEDIVFGPETAAVTIVEYSDFECPYCKTFHQDLRQVAGSYGDQVRVVYKHLPLSFHAQAANAALASECAHAQGKFDLYADHLFTKQGEWNKVPGLQKFKDYAWWLKLDYRAFATCLEGDTHKEKIARDQEQAATLHITSTPATFVNGTFLDGAVSKDDIKQAIETELAR